LVRSGTCSAALGDLDGDGNPDLAASAPGDDDLLQGSGSIYILFLNANGTVKAEQKISNTAGNFGGLCETNDLLGTCITNLGDLNGDGVTDIAAGVYGSNDGGIRRGAIWVIFLNSSGMVIKEQKISDIFGGFSGVLSDMDGFGFGIGAIGDIDGDGNTELAVGAYQDDDSLQNAGAVWVLFMDSGGKVKSWKKISALSGNFSGVLENDDYFGSSLTGIGDLDNDGIPDLVVGTTNDDDGGINKGAVYILFMKDKLTSSPDNLVLTNQSIYPNPCNSPCFLRIATHRNWDTGTQFVLYDMLGKVQLEQSDVTFPLSIDVQPGLYLFEYQTTGGQFLRGKIAVTTK